MNPPSQRQASVLDFIAEFAVERFRSPTVWEIAEEFEMSDRIARQHVAALVDGGWLIEITREGKVNRTGAFECAPAVWGRLASQTRGRRRRSSPAVAQAEAIVDSLLRKMTSAERAELFEALDRPTELAEKRELGALRNDRPVR